MVDIVSTALIPVPRSDLSQTIRTSDLHPSDESINTNKEYDSKSDSSSICHSPTWNDISGRKYKTEKREKKRREKKLERERKSYLASSEAAEPAPRPKKLSKQPPNPKRQSKIKIPHSSIDFGKLSLLRISSHGTVSHQEDSMNIRGLRVRTAEEHHVQDAIRQIRPRHEKRTSAQRSSTQSITQNPPHSQHQGKFCKVGSEGSPPHRRTNKISLQINSNPAKSHPEADGHTIKLAGTEKPFRENTHSYYSSQWPRDMQNVKLLNKNVLTDSNHYTSNEKINQVLDHSDYYNQFSQSQHLICDNEGFDMGSFYQSPDSTMPMIAPKSGVPNTAKPNRVSLSQSEGLKKMTNHNQGTSSHRQSTKELFQGAPENTSKEPKLAPHGKETIKSNVQSPQTYNSECTKNATWSAFGRNSSPLLPHSSLGHCGANERSHIRTKNNYSSQSLPTTVDNSHIRLDVSAVSPSNRNFCKSVSTPTVVDASTQQFKKTSYSAYFNPDTMNSSLRSSLARSTDSSEEYSTQDELSNITTPSASRPHSSTEKSPNEACRDQFFPTRIDSLALKKHFSKWAPDFKSGVEEHTHTPPIPINWSPDASKVSSTLTDTFPTSPPCDEDYEKTSIPLSRVKIPQASDISSQSLWISEEEKDETVKRGLIKRPVKSAGPPLATTAMNSDSSSSQYLQNARLRINHDVSLQPARTSTKSSTMVRSTAEPFAKMFVICCSCKYFHDMPSNLYASMVDPGNVVSDENMGVSGVITTNVKCPWCRHGMTTKCCAGYATVVYLTERLH